jgi:hypothetical protein
VSESSSARVSAFALAALGLAALGVYAVMGLTVAQREREIGIRMALGARVKDVVRMLVLESMRPVVWGLAAGAVGATFLTQALRSLLFRIEPSDPATFVGVTTILGVTAFAAALIPTLRAARSRPRWRTRSAPIGRLLQRLLQVLDQIPPPRGHRDAQAVGDPDPLALGFLDVGVGHGHGMGHQRLHRAQVLGEAPETQGVHDLLPRGHAAPDLEPHHRPEARSLPLREVVLRVRREAGVADAIDLGCDSRNSHRESVLRLRVHPDGERLHSLEGEPGDLGRRMIPQAFWTNRIFSRARRSGS